MRIVTDLHLHSSYSRAVSPQMNLTNMAAWAKIKGIDVLGTADFTHPVWFETLKNQLEPQEGVFGLKQEPSLVKFLLTTEISSIYTQDGKVRKIHSVILAPSFSAAEKIIKELKNKGANLNADGRPIIGLSARDLLALVLEADTKCMLIPAHIWTPWFSLFGSKSGFESIEQCFGPLSNHIYSVETGLSSDPQMNWQIPELENRSIVSFSDAHSLENLGRESTILEVEKINYDQITQALKDQTKINRTIEFFPEEGKYHFSGHRLCGVVLGPDEVLKKGTICPVCGKSLTIGVVQQVEKMAEKNKQKSEIETEIDEFGVKWTKTDHRPKFVKLVPLREIIAQVRKVGKSSQKVEKEYKSLTKHFGNELKLLTAIKPEEMLTFAGKEITEAIVQVRKGEIFIDPGFDGIFGKVSLKKDNQKENNNNSQVTLF